MAKPVQDAKWATSGTALIMDPGAGKRDQGWIVEIPPVEYFNWWMNNVGNWIDYLDTQVDAVIALQGIYDAIVGSGTGTYATINDVIAAMDGVTLPVQDVKIFVKDPLTATTTQLINKEGVDIEFHPKAAFAKGAALVIGLQIDAKRVKVKNGRFLNFDEIGGVAVDLTANAKNCFVERNTFVNNTSELVDAGANNTKTNNIEEIA